MLGTIRWLLMLTIAVAAGSVRAQPALGPQQGVLLLRNGELIEGRITFSGDRYDVGLRDGEIRVKAADVEFCGSTVQQCFEHRRANLEADKIDDHLNLAEWCLRRGLLENAAGALSEAMTLDISHPRIGLLERRLKLAVGERPPHEAAAGSSAARETVTLEELDRMVRSMPPHSVETFTATIQPLLLNNCSTAGCHGPQSAGSLRLMRVPPGRQTGRRSTQRNLHAALALIDREHPDRSPLLLVPNKPHGTVKSAIFTSREVLQYKQLVDWVYAVASFQVPARPATLEEPASSLLQTVDDAVGKSTSASDGRVFGETEPAAKGSTSPAKPQAEVLPVRSAPQRGELPQGFVPKDPFDPEIFNRKYFGKQTATK